MQTPSEMKRTRQRGTRAPNRGTVGGCSPATSFFTVSLRGKSGHSAAGTYSGGWGRRRGWMTFRRKHFALFALRCCDQVESKSTSQETTPPTVKPQVAVSATLSGCRISTLNRTARRGYRSHVKPKRRAEFPHVVTVTTSHVWEIPKQKGA